MARNTALFLLVVLVLGAGCSKKRSQPAAKPAAPAASGAQAGPVHGAGATALAVASSLLESLARKVLEDCTVSPYGVVRQCEGGILQRLSAREKSVGHKTALMTYCRAMSDPDALVRALAASRISLLSSPAQLARAANPRLLTCLLGTLARTKKSELARPLAQAAAYTATALKREAELINILDASGKEGLRAAGYGALWANGRQRVLARLKPVITEGESLPVRIAAIKGFSVGAPLSKEERLEVCTLLSPLLQERLMAVAAATVLFMSNHCPLMADEILQAASARQETSTLDLSTINAIHSLSSRTLSTKQRQVVVQIYSSVANGAYVPLVRSSALRNLHDLSPEAGRKLANILQYDSAHFVATTARKILVK